MGLAALDPNPFTSGATKRGGVRALDKSSAPDHAKQITLSRSRPRERVSPSSVPGTASKLKLKFAKSLLLPPLSKKLNEEGTTIVQVTHSEVNASYGNRIVNLFDGWLKDDVLVAQQGTV